MIEGSRILLVDDNPEIIQLLSDFLTPYNCEVFKASMGKEAIELLDGESVEIAILDIKLPDMDGIALLEEIRLRDPTIGVVMITGYNDPDMIIEAMKKGASDFLMKPFSIDKLTLSIMRVRKQRDLVVERNSILSDLEDKTKIELLNRQLQTKVAQVTKMYHISNNFNSLNIFEDIYEKTVLLVNEVLNAEVSGYYVVDHENQQLMLYKTKTRGRANGVERSIALTPDLSKAMKQGNRHFELNNKAYAPLVIKGECVGAIMMGKKGNGNRSRNFTEDDTYFLKFIADKASMQIENRMLYESLFEGVLHTLTSLIVAINRRDFYTEDHCKRVAEMCLALADRVGATEYQKDEVRVVAPVHDVGKIGIPDSILLKPSKLTGGEYDLMKNHSIFGEEIINRFDILSNEAKITRHHHESFDGSGYPDGLAGEEIPFCSRLIAICDTYDAMVNDRPYRKGLPKEETLAEIGRCKGSQLDPHMTEAFLEMMNGRHSSN
ncbi:MAG TPA: HD domain-containing phosphohydrolase [Syntrophorhabdales bacterium]|nr:HD domain-containing phosphohydrolase [Syntrophorhabdales bacterium]